MGQFQNVPGPSQDEFNAQTQAIANLDYHALKHVTVSVACNVALSPAIGGCTYRSNYYDISTAIGSIGHKIASVLPHAWTGGYFIPVVRYDELDCFCLFGTYSETITCDVIYYDD